MKQRKSENNIEKLNSTILLFQENKDERIETIRIYSENLYLINDKWTVNLISNTVSRSYPDPE